MKEIDEEIINSLTHLISGIACAFVFMVIVLDGTILAKEKIKFLPMIGTTTWTFFSSFLYHGTRENQTRKRNRQLDKSAIFLMILGCGITTILTCHDKNIAITFSIALCAVIFFLLFKYCTVRDFPDWISVASYVTVGWVATFPSLGIFSESDYTQYGIIPWVLTTGGLYCVGVIFYSRDGIKWFHTIWHLFVMAAAGIHISCHIYIMKMNSIPI